MHEGSREAFGYVVASAIFLFPSPVASCGGVSQASSPRSGTPGYREKWTEGRCPLPEPGIHEFIYTHVYLHLVFHMRQNYGDTNPQDSCEQVRARTMQRLETFCKRPEKEHKPHHNIFLTRNTKAKEPL